MMTSGYGLARAVYVQLVVTCLVPLAIGLLGAAAYGRRTGLLAVVFSSLYFPFIEYGALFLSEIHFIFWLALAFAGLFGARRVRRPAAAIGVSAAAGFALSIATSLKSVALPAAVLFFFADGVALLLARPAGGPPARWFDRLKPWLLRGAVVAVAAAPLLGVLARVCTRANEGRFCVTGNKIGLRLPARPLRPRRRHRMADGRARPVPIRQPRRPAPPLRGARDRAVLDDRQRPATRPKRGAGSASTPARRSSCRWTTSTTRSSASSAWPTFNSGSWPYANLSQYVFIDLPVRADGAGVRPSREAGPPPRPDQPDRSGARADRGADDHRRDRDGRGPLPDSLRHLLHRDRVRLRRRRPRARRRAPPRRGSAPAEHAQADHEADRAPDAPSRPARPRCPRRRRRR